MRPTRPARHAAVAALVLLCTPAFAAEATLAGDLWSAYKWRGLTFAGGPVLQPSLDVSGLGPLTVNVWGNFNLGDWDGRLREGQFSEVDFTVTARLPRGFTIGYVEYVFTVGEPSTRELTAAWSREYAALTPTVSLSYDVEQIDSGFLLLSLQRDAELSERLSLALKAEVGYAGDGFATYYGGERGGLYHFALTARLTRRLGDEGSVSGAIGYADGFSREVLPRPEARLYGGVSLSRSF